MSEINYAALAGNPVAKDAVINQLAYEQLVQVQNEAAAADSNTEDGAAFLKAYRAAGFADYQREAREKVEAAIEAALITQPKAAAAPVIEIAAPAHE